MDEQARLPIELEAYEALSFSSAIRPAVKGHVPTPPTVVDLMVSKVFYRRSPKPTDLLIDPGCGDGPFIAGVLRYCAARGLEPPKILGVELDPRHLKVARSKFGGARSVHLIEADYLERDLGPADFVLGNPPYVPITDLSQDEKARFRSRYQSAAGRFDLYLLFMEQSIRNLKPNGRLCFITPEKFEYVATAGPLRKLLSCNTVREIHHVSEQTFPGLVTYPAITTLVKRGPSPEWKTRVLSRSGGSSEVALPSDGSPWNGVMNGGQTPADHISLEDVSLRISCGIATGADAIFVMDSSELPPSLRRFARPTVSGRQLARLDDRIEARDVMLLPYDKRGRLLPEQDLGDLRTHLARPDNQRALKARTCFTEGKKEWYAFHDTVPMEDLERPKILCKDIAPEPKFWVDEEGGIIPRHSVYYIVPRPDVPLARVLEHLRSEFATEWLRAHTQRAANGYLRLQSSVLRRLPVPAELAPRAARAVRRASVPLPEFH